MLPPPPPPPPQSLPLVGGCPATGANAVPAGNMVAFQTPFVNRPAPLLGTGATLHPTQEGMGIIFPPAEIRGIIDKTAQFVAKNGPDFEQRVLADRTNGAKFSFLVMGNPYRAYYDAKVREFQSGEVSETVQKQVPQAILEIKKREAEKKQKKEQLLALTAYATEPHMATQGGTESNALVRMNGDGSGGSETFDPQRRSLLAIEDENPPVPPAEDQFTAARPYATSLDIDVIKLTAQYVARNGQKFLVGLSQRERGNPQFSFLRSTHVLFPYFTLLVDAYTRCLMPDKALLESLKQDVGIEGRLSVAELRNAIRPTDMLDGPVRIPPDQTAAMLRIAGRVESRYRWEVYDAKCREAQSQREQEERQQMHAMDWHEFTVVEVINFAEEDDKLPLGPPIEYSSLLHPTAIPALASTPGAQDAEGLGLDSAAAGPPSSSFMAEVREAVGAEALQGAGLLPGQPTITPPTVTSSPVVPPIGPSTDGSMPPPTYPVGPIVLPTASGAVPSPSAAGIMGPPFLAPPTQLPPPPIPPASILGATGFSDGPPEPLAPAAAPIVVVKGYVRQGKRRARAEGQAGMQKCPLTGQWVPVEQMSEHLRILLLDPKWKEQKDILLAKAQKESAFAPETDFEANLANFVVKRPDLFGTVEDECESSYVPNPKRAS